MKNAIRIGSLIISFFIIMSLPVNAAKVLPRFQSSGGKVGPKKASGGGGVYSSARLRGDRKAVNVSFSNLGAARDVTYILTYQTNGKEEGISGSVDVSSGSATRELLFGTCSSGVCRYHSGITNMRLEISGELTSGKKFVRRYRIRV